MRGLDEKSKYTNLSQQAIPRVPQQRISKATYQKWSFD